MSISNVALREEGFFKQAQAVCTAECKNEKLVSADGVKDYPVIEFDEKALAELSDNVRAALKNSDVVPAGGRIYRTLKRTVDIAVSLAGITVLALPMSLISLLIYSEDKGNPIFSQVRITKDGKTFRMYKFRSMCMDAEERFAEVQKTNQCDGLAFKMENDPRVTRIGRFLRKTSIDELPQLFNVLKGDMSLIGPRPPLPREVNLYSPYQMQRLLVKGGLACYCQCNGRSDMPFDEWVASDIKYIEERSMRSDLGLLAKTVKVVLNKKGAC